MTSHKNDSSLSRKIYILSAQQGFKKHFLDSDRTKLIKYILDTRNYLLNHGSEVEKLWQEHESEMANHWGSMSTWTRLDITLISLGINHQYFREDLLSGIGRAQMVNLHVLDKEYYKRYTKILSQHYGDNIEREFCACWQIITSNFNVGAISTTDIIDWFESKDIAFPTACIENIRKFNNTLNYRLLYEQERSSSQKLVVERDKYKNEADKAKKSKSAQVKETKNLKKAYYLLAKRAFPTLQSDSNYASTIASYLNTEGIVLSEETARKNFNDGKKLFEGQALEEENGNNKEVS